MFIRSPPNAWRGISQRCTSVMFDTAMLRSTHPTAMMGGCWTSIRRQLASGRRYVSLLSRKSCISPAPKAVAHELPPSAGNQYGNFDARRGFCWRGVLVGAGWKNRICWIFEDPWMHLAHWRLTRWARRMVCMSTCVRIASRSSFGNDGRAIICFWQA